MATRVTIPAPWQGMNVKDGEGSVPMEQALILRNWICRPGYCELRRAMQFYDNTTPQILAARIHTIAPHPNGTIIVLGWNAGAGRSQYSFFDTATNAYTSTDTNLGADPANFNWVQHSDRIILCNGVEPVMLYDGTSVSAIVVTGPATDYFWACQSFKGRVFYWFRNQRTFWYAAAGAYQGALTAFDLSTFVLSNANLVAMVPMTNDGGQGADDLAAFIFDNGEVLLYQGDDPGNADAWTQVGRYKIGKPMGPMGWCMLGSATVVATRVGPVDLARALALGADDNGAVVGQGITGTRTADSSRAQMMVVPSQRFMMLVKYDDGGFACEVWVMDLDTRGWSQFNQNGWDYLASNYGVTCIGVAENSVWGSNTLYIGCDGPSLSLSGYLCVYGIESTYNAEVTEFTISPQFGPYGTEALTGYGDFDAAGQLKQVTAVSFNSTPSNTASSISLAIYSDLAFIGNEYGAAPFSQSPVSTDTMKGAFASWSADGFSLALYCSMNGAIGVPVRWYGTSLLVEVGGQL